jgi:hypothetical protein
LVGAVASEGWRNEESRANASICPRVVAISRQMVGTAVFGRSMEYCDDSYVPHGSTDVS